MTDKEIVADMLNRAGIKIRPLEECFSKTRDDDGSGTIEILEKRDTGEQWIRFNFNPDGSLESIDGRDS
jgi:hypothetical protein